MAFNLKQLSEALGLSQTTVSRALNGYPEVSEATRARVAQAAQDHNYSPNTRAKGLATGRAWAIGHVIPVTDKHQMVNPIFGDFIAGAGESYARSGYDMHLSIADKDNEEAVYKRLKSRGSIDGVVLHGPRMNDPRIDLLTNLGMPFVVHGRASEESRSYSWLDVNNRSAFHRATSFLLDLGHTRIGLINGLEFMDFAHRRRQGYQSALAERSIKVDPDLMKSDEMTEGYGYRSTKELLAMDNPPTALLSSSVICALGARRAIEERGQKMGKDVSVVSYDDCLSYLQNDGEVPVFTALRSSVRDAGEKLGQMLIDQIQGSGLAAQQVLLEAELTVGHSTGPCPSPNR